MSKLVSIINFMVDFTHFISFLELMPPDTCLVQLYLYPPTPRHGADHPPPTGIPTDRLAGDQTRLKHFTVKKKRVNGVWFSSVTLVLIASFRCVLTLLSLLAGACFSKLSVCRCHLHADKSVQPANCIITRQVAITNAVSRSS